MVQVEILQNGISMDSYNRPLKNSGKIVISAHKGHLTLPHYPLADDLTLLQLDGKKAHLVPDPQMMGFATQSGAVTDLAHDHFSVSNIEMASGDYASIEYRDLVIMIKIGAIRQKHERKISLDPRYRGKIGFNLFANRFEARQLWISLAMATFIMAVALTTALKLSHPIEYTKRNIPVDFQLGLIDPELLDTAPEALQNKLNRKNYMGSAIGYYENLANLYSGVGLVDEQLLFDTSANRSLGHHRRYSQTIGNTIDREQELTQATLKHRGAAMISIPTVIGESAAQKSIRSIHKFDLRLKAYRTLLESRRTVTEEFTRDDEYPFNEYKNISTVDKATEMLSQISPFNLLTDERDMYFQAKQLSLLGHYQHSQLRKYLEPGTLLSEKSYRPIRVISSAPFIHVAGSMGSRSFDRKMSLLKASDLVKKTKKSLKVKEPLVGEIDPKLVEGVISKGRFELQLCYELALRRNSATSGTIEWSWRVDSRGDTSDVELVSSTIKDSDMINCLRKKISAWRFPRPIRGSVLIRYPFAFKPRKG